MLTRVCLQIATSMAVLASAGAATACSAIKLDGSPMAEGLATTDASFVSDEKRAHVASSLVWLTALRPDFFGSEIGHPTKRLIASVASQPSATEKYLSTIYSNWSVHNLGDASDSDVMVLYEFEPDYVTSRSYGLPNLSAEGCLQLRLNSDDKTKPLPNFGTEIKLEDITLETTGFEVLEIANIRPDWTAPTSVGAVYTLLLASIDVSDVKKWGFELPNVTSYSDLILIRKDVR